MSPNRPPIIQIRVSFSEFELDERLGADTERLKGTRIENP